LAAGVGPENPKQLATDKNQMHADEMRRFLVLSVRIYEIRGLNSETTDFTDGHG
jgi:hypothetical protein